MPVLMESAFTFPLAKDAKTGEVCQVRLLRCSVSGRDVCKTLNFFAEES